MKNEIITIFKKNEFSDIHASLRENKNLQLVDIRTWVLTQGSNEKIPTCKGISIKIEDLSKLKDALNKIEKVY